MAKQQYAEDTIHLRDYLWVLNKRRWAVLAVFSAFVISFAVYTFTRVPSYRSTTQILIEKENPNIVDFKELYAIDATSQDFYQTQYNILQSRFLAKKVIDRFIKEGRINELFPDENPGNSVYASMGSQDAQALQSMEDKRIDRFLKNLEIEPVRNTRLAKLHYTHRDPKTAATTSNMIVSVYIEHNLETKLEAVQGASDILKNKIDEQRKWLEESELLLQYYIEQNNIVSLKEKENITVSKLAELNTDVIKAENERVEAEMRFKQAASIEDKSEMIESIPKVLSNTFVMGLKTEEAQLASELSELSKKFGPKHPKLISVSEKLKTTREKLSMEIKKVVNYLKNEYDVVLAKEETLKKALELQKEEIQRLNKLAIAYGVLQRDVDTNKQLYDVLLTRFKETGITGGIQTSNVRVVDKAMPPLKPIKPRKKLNFVLSIMLGLVGGVGFAFFMEYLDNTVKTPEDIKRFIDIPYLGPIPSFKPELESYDDGSTGLVTLNSPKSTSAEAYRGIRTAIVFSSSAGASKKTMLITSASPSEGKSLTASNLAVIMAQSNLKTLLVDTDFRKPRIHKIFGIGKENGITNVLVGASALEDVIFKTTLPNLDVLTVGHLPPNPAELLGSNNMKNIIHDLSARYDKVIFDSPPVLPVTDSVVLGTVIDEVVLVVSAGVTSRDLIKRAVDQLKDVGANVTGAVLNNIKVGQESYYYYQYNYYYYGESNDKKRTKKRKQKHTNQDSDSAPDASINA